MTTRLCKTFLRGPELMTTPYIIQSFTANTDEVKQRAADKFHPPGGREKK